MSNKKGQFESKLLAIIIIFIIAIILFFFNRVNLEIYAGFDKYLNESETLNDTEAHDALRTIKEIEEGHTWDYVFLAIFVGVVLQIILFSFATRINVAFFWIMLILDIPILIVGVVLSNIWQSLAANPEFATTITRFPITNTLLGTYFPIAIVIILFLAAIFLFGKRPGVE